MNQRVSVIIPTLNEGAVITDLLSALQTIRPQHQIILSDGGSTDGTCAQAKPLVDIVLSGSAGRAIQMNRGAAQASGDLLWFLHADTCFAQAPLELVESVLQANPRWGRFNIRLDASKTVYRLIEKLVNWRSCFSQVATGDQGIFIRRTLFEQLGGYAGIPLMEDIELSKRARRLHPAYCAQQTLITSARRWQTHGVLKTVLLMWYLRLAYTLGVAPERLAQHYRLCNSPTHVS